MCIAIAIKKGVKLPSEEILRRCFTSNRDGAGFTYFQDGYNHFTKGLMTIEAFLEAIKSIPEGAPALLHFRIGTHGSKNSPEHTHPFPVTHDTNSLFMTAGRFKGDMVVHNGIFAGFGDVPAAVKDRKMSDTQDFTSQLSLAGGRQSSGGGVFISKNLAACRLAFLTSEGEITTYGTWEESEGVLYSNSGYKPYVPSFTCDPRTWGHSSRYCGEQGDYIPPSMRGSGLWDCFANDDDGVPYSKRGRKNRNRGKKINLPTTKADPPLVQVMLDQCPKLSKWTIENLLVEGLSPIDEIQFVSGEVCSLEDFLSDYGVSAWDLRRTGDYVCLHSTLVARKLPIPIGEIVESGYDAYYDALADAEPEATALLESPPKLDPNGVPLTQGDWTTP